jgi:TP901 family phage tail tape measure protein
MRTIFDVIARDGASGPLGKVSASMQRMGASARSAGRDIDDSAAKERKRQRALQSSSMSMVAIGGGLALAGSGIARSLDEARKVSGAFEYQLAGLKSVSNATAAEMRAFETAAKKAGVETQYMPAEAAAALQTLSQAGFNAKQSMDLLRPSLDLAASSAGQLTVDMGASVIQQAIKGFGVQVRDAGMATDQMLKAVQMFAIDAGDLPLGLSNVSRGAQRMRQSFSESMITFGLVRNTIARVETAATATGIAMERMANKDVGAKIKSALGVDVAVGGKFRSYLDIIGDMVPKLQQMTETKRANFFEQTFGTEGARGIQAIYEQLTNGIQTQEGATLRGADAIAYMRQQMGAAQGTAANFRAALLATSDGLDILWKGSIATAQTSIGQAYARIVDPMKRTALGALNAFIEAFGEVPGVAQQATVGLVGMSAAVLKVAGVSVAAVGALRLLGFGFKDVILGIGKTLLLSAPLIGVLGAIGVGFYGLHRAAQKNIGGVGGAFTGMWDKVKLAWRGTLELVSGAGFSEATKKSLQDAQNSGVAKFLVWVTGAIGRAKAFFGGMVDGFDAGLQRLDGPMQRFRGVLESIFGFGREGDPAAEMQRWSTAGARLGDRLADLSAWVLDLATNGLKTLKSAFEGISLADVERGLRAIVTVFEAMASAVQTIAAGIQKVMDFKTAWGALGLSTAEMTPQQMLATTNLTSGSAARAALEQQMQNLTQMREMGIIDRGQWRRSLEAAAQGQILTGEAAGDVARFSLGAGNAMSGGALSMTGRGPGDWLQSQAAANKRIGDNIETMTKAVNVLAERGFRGAFYVDGQRLGEAVDAAGQSRQEADYYEFPLQTVPMSVWGG